MTLQFNYKNAPINEYVVEKGIFSRSVIRSFSQQTAVKLKRGHFTVKVKIGILQYFMQFEGLRILISPLK